MRSPATNLAMLLDDALVGAVAKAQVTLSRWLIKVGRMSEETNRLIVCSDTGGSTPNPKWALDFPNISVFVRGGVNEYEEAWVKANQVKSALLGIDPTVFEDVRWDGITMRSDIFNTGYDERDRPTFSLNFRVIQEPVVGGVVDALSHRSDLGDGSA